MFKSALAAALIIGAASSSAYAKQTQYYFETAGGGEYCDGLLLKKVGDIFTGTHNSPLNECTEGDQAGGFYADGFGSGAMGEYDTVKKGTKLATITTEDEPNGGTNFLIIFNLDLKAKKWAVFVYEDGGSPVNGGPLGIGTDAQVHPHLNRPAFRK
jgi:hypothetical protein